MVTFQRRPMVSALPVPLLVDSTTMGLKKLKCFCFDLLIVCFRMKSPNMIQKLHCTVLSDEYYNEFLNL